MDNNTLGIFAIGGGIFVVVAVILFFYIRKRLSSSWTGKIVDKKIIEGSSGDSTSASGDIYYLYIDTGAGKSIKIDVNRKFFDELKVGDRLQKKPGQYNPVKIS